MRHKKNRGGGTIIFTSTNWSFFKHPQLHLLTALPPSAPFLLFPMLSLNGIFALSTFLPFSLSFATKIHELFISLHRFLPPSFLFDPSERSSGLKSGLWVKPPFLSTTNFFTSQLFTGWIIEISIGQIIQIRFLPFTSHPKDFANLIIQNEIR